MDRYQTTTLLSIKLPVSYILEIRSLRTLVAEENLLGSEKGSPGLRSTPVYHIIYLSPLIWMHKIIQGLQITLPSNTIWSHVQFLWPHVHLMLSWDASPHCTVGKERFLSLWIVLSILRCPRSSKRHVCSLNMECFSFHDSFCVNSGDCCVWNPRRSSVSERIKTSHQCSHHGPSTFFFFCVIILLPYNWLIVILACMSKVVLKWPMSA